VDKPHQLKSHIITHYKSLFIAYGSFDDQICIIRTRFHQTTA